MPRSEKEGGCIFCLSSYFSAVYESILGGGGGKEKERGRCVCATERRRRAIRDDYKRAYKYDRMRAKRDFIRLDAAPL